MGFVLILFEFNKPGISNYVSNALREDMITALRETADRLEKKEDVPTGIGAVQYKRSRLTLIPTSWHISERVRAIGMSAAYCQIRLARASEIKFGSGVTSHNIEEMVRKEDLETGPLGKGHF